MFSNILIPIALDHDSDVQVALDAAHRLLSPGGKITLVAVIEEVPAYVAEYATVKPRAHLQAEIRDRLAALVAGDGDVDLAILAGKPGVVIPDLASETSAELIVIHSHKPGVEDYFLGSTASRVVRRAPCTVLVLR